jgi:hypothetical protein
VKPDPVWGIPEIPASQCRAPAPAAVASALKPALRSPALSGGETVESEMCLYFVMESEMNHPLADLIASHDAIVFKAMVQCVLAAPGSSATSPCTEIRIPETKIPVDSSAAPMCSVF